MRLLLAACLLMAGGGSARAEQESPVFAPADSLAIVPDPGPALTPDRPPVDLSAASPIAVLARFEEAWRAGAVDTLVACLSANSIEIAIHQTGPPGGHFPPSQAGFLFRDLLYYGGPQHFRVVRFEWKEDELPHGEVEWAHQMAGDEVHERLDIVLAREAEGWRIVRVVTR